MGTGRVRHPWMPVVRTDLVLKMLLEVDDKRTNFDQCTIESGLPQRSVLGPRKILNKFFSNYITLLNSLEGHIYFFLFPRWVAQRKKTLGSSYKKSCLSIPSRPNFWFSRRKCLVWPYKLCITFIQWFFYITKEEGKGKPLTMLRFIKLKIIELIIQWLHDYSSLLKIKLISGKHAKL